MQCIVCKTEIKEQKEICPGCGAFLAGNACKTELSEAEPVVAQESSRIKYILVALSIILCILSVYLVQMFSENRVSAQPIVIQNSSKQVLPEINASAPVVIEQKEEPKVVPEPIPQVALRSVRPVTIWFKDEKGHNDGPYAVLPGQDTKAIISKGKYRVKVIASKRIRTENIEITGNTTLEF